MRHGLKSPIGTLKKHAWWVSIFFFDYEKFTDSEKYDEGTIIDYIWMDLLKE
jgi:hypothetical protein